MIWLFLASFVHLFHSRRSLWLENLALRQRLVALKRMHPGPRLTRFDKLFWVFAKGSPSRSTTKKQYLFSEKATQAAGINHVLITVDGLVDDMPHKG